MTLIGIIIAGAIIGALARLVIPGRQAMGMLITIVVGIIGALVGNFVGEAISPDGTMHWILSILVAAVLVAAVGGATRRRV